MTIQDAVLQIAERVRDTHKPLSEVVKDIGPFTFSDEDTQTLLYEALASRTGPLLTNPLRYVAARNEMGGSTVSVSAPPLRTTVERHEVTVQLLHDAVYHVNGVAKPIAVFTQYDVLTKLESVRRVAAGIARHQGMWEYISERLVTLKKAQVSDLAPGEQMKIARMVYDLRQQKDTPELA